MNSSILKHANENFQRKIAPLAKSHNGVYNHVGGVYKEGFRADEIIGHWHEDGCEFIIKCPEQLRDCLMEVLNNLHLLEFKKEV